MKRFYILLPFLVSLGLFSFSASALYADDGVELGKKELDDLGKDLKAIFDAKMTSDRDADTKAQASFNKRMSEIAGKKGVADIMRFCDQIYRVKELTIDKKDKVFKSKAGKGFVEHVFTDYTDQDRNYKYYVSIPKAYKPMAEERFPVLIYLHSKSGGKNSRAILKSVKNELRTVFKDKALLEKTFVIVPIGPELGKKKRLVEAANDWEKLDPGLKTAFIAVRVVMEKIVYDRGKVLVSGFGRNGLTALRFATQYPSLFSGAFVVDAPLEPMYLENGGGMNFTFVSTSGNDKGPAEALAEKFTGEDGGPRVTVVEDDAPAGKIPALTETGNKALLDLLALPSRNTCPDKIVMKSIDLSYNSNGWLQIHVMNNTTSMKIGSEDVPSIEAGVDRDSNTFSITSERIGKFRIFLSDKLIDMDKKIVVNLNGEIRWEGTKERNPLLMVQMLFENWAGDYEVYTNYIDIESKDT
jgi:hypothetical protein